MVQELLMQLLQGSMMLVDPLPSISKRLHLMLLYPTYSHYWQPQAEHPNLSACTWPVGAWNCPAHGIGLNCHDPFFIFVA